jgi:N utilization substance protein A
MVEANKQLVAAIKQICEEKGLSQEQVIVTIEQALAAAYRKDFGTKNQNIKVEFNLADGTARVFDVKTVVDDSLVKEAEEAKERKAAGEDIVQKEGEEAKVKKFNPKTDIALSEAKKIRKKVKIGDIIKQELEVSASYGRMAAQTAKQVIIQKLREAERETVFNEFKQKEHKVVTGFIQRREGRIVLVDIGRTTAVLPPEGQVENERYNPSHQMKFYIVSVNLGTKGPEIVLSRTHEEILRELFKIEIPEIASGLVEIRSLAREAGARSKVAVASREKNIDPIGSCIGQRGSRIQTIIAELGGEKIDIIEYSDEPEKFIINALSPAKVVGLTLDQENKIALVKVKPEQFSLAIGRGGQNVRLAAKLTGWKIEIGEEKTTEKEKDKQE